MSTEKITGWRNRQVESDAPLGNAFTSARGWACEKAFNGQNIAISKRTSANASKVGPVPSLSTINTDGKVKAKPASGMFTSV